MSKSMQCEEVVSGPPDPLFVLRKPCGKESGINHITVFDHPVDGLVIILSDQAGHLDWWSFQQRRHLLSFNIPCLYQNFNRNEKPLKLSGGLIWTNVFVICVDNTNEKEHAIILASQCRNGNVYLLTFPNDISLTTVSESMIEFCPPIETHFTAFCKCEFYLDELTKNSVLVAPFDSNGENLFKAFEMVLPFKQFVHESTLKVNCPKKHGLPMCLKVLTVYTSKPFLIAFEDGCICVMDSREEEDVLCCLDLNKADIGSGNSAANTLTAAVAVSSDCSKVIVGSSDHFISVLSLINCFDGNTGQLQLELSHKIQITNNGISCLRFRPTDDRLYVSAGWDFAIRFFSTKTNKPLAVLTWHSASIVALAFHHSLLFSACKEGKIACWKLFC